MSGSAEKQEPKGTKLSDLNAYHALVQARCSAMLTSISIILSSTTVIITFFLPKYDVSFLALAFVVLLIMCLATTIAFAFRALLTADEFQDELFTRLEDGELKDRDYTSAELRRGFIAEFRRKNRDLNFA